MYSVKPLGLNLKSSDRDIKDGFLQESINLQWRDNALRPIPERLISDIDTTGYSNIIAHKVSDENQINVLGFQLGSSSIGSDLAFDLSEFLGGGASQSGYLYWIGKIVDGVYTAITPIAIPQIINTDGMSFTILNGLIYFIGDGSSDDEQYYLRLQYNESSELYETKDMYAWKSLIPFYPKQDSINLTLPKEAVNVFSQCGIILTRITLVLKSGEEVLHSPVYCNFLHGINKSSTQIDKDSLIENIHTFINLNFEFHDDVLYGDEITAINVYSSLPYYDTKLKEDYDTSGGSIYSPIIVNGSTVIGELQRLSELPFYMIKTIDKPTSEKILLTVGEFDPDIVYAGTYSKIDVSTIAAGELMPVDNFSYHSIYGGITSFNGRLIIEKPRTVLSGGHIRALALEEDASRAGFWMETEDGSIDGVAYQIDKALRTVIVPGVKMHCRGLLSYPDKRAITVGGGSTTGTAVFLYKCRGNGLHNMACSFSISDVVWDVFGANASGDDMMTFSTYEATLVYPEPYMVVGLFEGTEITQAKYSSENRAQFSTAGEFSVWPAINSYRIGEGKIMNIGSNSVNPSNADIVAPLTVGTSDGIYTINFDPTGQILVSSITKAKNIPYISKETLLIDGMIIFVSDKGLMAINNGDVINLTKDFFPEQGNGGFPDPNTVYANYNLLTNSYFGGSNPYVLTDIVDYMKGAIFAYDARRESIWCCNPSKNFSMVFSIPYKMWGMSTTVFSEKTELFSLLSTSEGDIFSRFLIKNATNSNLLILSGEDPDTEVFYHFLTRPIKLQYPNNYKKLRGMYSRCELFRDVAASGYFSFGAWGKQDHNKNKVSIPITAKSDNRAAVYPGNVRQDIPIGWRKGKYKSVVVLQGGQTLPESSIDSIDFDVFLVKETKTR